MTQQLRRWVIEQLKNKALDIVVAPTWPPAALTCRASRPRHQLRHSLRHRGLCAPHRPRTGRTGRTGNAILFVARREATCCAKIQERAAMADRSAELPSREAVADKRVAAFRQQVADVPESRT